MDLLNPNTWPQKTSILQDAQANSTEEGRRLETLDVDDNNVGVSLIDWMEVMCACQLTAWLIRDISNLKLVSGCLYASQ